MTIFAAMRQGESGWVIESTRRTVNHLSHHRQ
jgi:hypothetical protein